MARFSYETLQGDNVLFKQGTQAALNAYLPTSSDATKKGKAIEGAFYLTTDTHRLYIGRKVSTLPNPNPYNVAVNDIYPEEISNGIATVVDTGELNQVQITGDAHDGDFYYIKSSNVLAVFEEDGEGGGSWHQVNSPTGIDTFSAGTSSVAPSSTPTFGNGSTYVRIRESLKPAGINETKNSDFWLKAGDNVTLKPSNDNTTVEISSANSQSVLTLADSTATANKAKATLSDDVNFDSNLYFVGAQDTTADAANTYKASSDTSVVAHKAYYTRSGSAEPYTYTLVTAPTGNPSTSNYYEKESTVTITGPGVNGTVITERGTAGATTGVTGFQVAVQVKNGATSTTNNKAITASGANSILDPIIRVGDSDTEDIHFRGGRADLPVYTKDETDTAIEEAITDSLRGIDALHYVGTVASASALSAADNGTLHQGDVYKASAAFDYTANNETVHVKTGDLLIARGTETSGVIAAGGASWELVPSGDEPVLKGIYNNSNVLFGLEDTNIVAAYDTSASDSVRLAKRPLQVQFDNANSTLISAAMTGSAADKLKITLSHTAPASGNVTTVTSATVTGTGTDTLSTKDQTATFVALSSITRDAYGHVTNVAGDTITIKHNYLTAFNTTHSAGTTSTGTYGQALVGANDTFGFSNSATKAAVKIASDSLNITAAQDNTQMNINLVWQNF